MNVERHNHLPLGVVNKLIPVPGEVLAQQGDQERRQRDRPRGGPCLRRTQPPHRPRFVQRPHQRIDHDHATPEIDIVPVQTGQFTPPAAGPRRGDDQQPRDRPTEQTGLLGNPHHLLRRRPYPLRHGAP
ncbi:hypothetical protein ACWED2_29390 [Amycolatopsis sp. NPDC005003]